MRFGKYLIEARKHIQGRHPPERQDRLDGRWMARQTYGERSRYRLRVGVYALLVATLAFRSMLSAFWLRESTVFAFQPRRTHFQNYLKTSKGITRYVLQGVDQVHIVQEVKKWIWKANTPPSGAKMHSILIETQKTRPAMHRPHPGSIPRSLSYKFSALPIQPFDRCCFTGGCLPWTCLFAFIGNLPESTL